MGKKVDQQLRTLEATVIGQIIDVSLTSTVPSMPSLKIFKVREEEGPAAQGVTWSGRINEEVEAVLIKPPTSVVHMTDLPKTVWNITYEKCQIARTDFDGHRECVWHDLPLASDLGMPLKFKKEVGVKEEKALLYKNKFAEIMSVCVDFNHSDDDIARHSFEVDALNPVFSDIVVARKDGQPLKTVDVEALWDYVTEELRLLDNLAGTAPYDLDDREAAARALRPYWLHAGSKRGFAEWWYIWQSRKTATRYLALACPVEVEEDDDRAPFGPERKGKVRREDKGNPHHCVVQ